MKWRQAILIYPTGNGQQVAGSELEHGLFWQDIDWPLWSCTSAGEKQRGGSKTVRGSLERGRGRERFAGEMMRRRRRGDDGIWSLLPEKLTGWAIQRRESHLQNGKTQQESSLLLQWCIAMFWMWLGPIGFVCLFVCNTVVTMAMLRGNGNFKKCGVGEERRN